jgi:hypothetical protein
MFVFLSRTRPPKFTKSSILQRVCESLVESRKTITYPHDVLLRLFARQNVCPGCMQNTHRKIQNMSCARLEWLYNPHFPPALPSLFSTIPHIHISPKSKMDTLDVDSISCCAQPKICVHRIHAWTMLRKQSINSKSTRKRRPSLCSAAGFMSKLNAGEFTCIRNQKSPHTCS